MQLINVFYLFREVLCDPRMHTISFQGHPSSRAKPVESH